MGRGRVQLKRIENKISRQVTFSKRRSGLVKKAHEISVLCEADVALIIFSTKGKLFDYSSADSSVDSILARYERCSYSGKYVTSEPEQPGGWSMEQAKLISRAEILHKSIRNMKGEELDPLSLKELQNLEQQIDTALKRIRLRKNHLMHEAISTLQKKERALLEQNNSLVKQLKDNGKTLADREQLKQLRSVGLDPPASVAPAAPPPTPVLGLASPNAGMAQEAREQANEHEQDVETPPRMATRTTIPFWMLPHVNR